MKKKSRDLFDDVMDNTMISTGIVAGTGLVSRLPSSPQTSKVLGGMETMRILPTIHASGVVFKGLHGLSDVERKIKKR